MTDPADYCYCRGIGSFIFFSLFIFKDPHHIFIYTLEDIAFIPIEVLFVTIIIHRLLEDRDKRSKLKKINMVIGAFYSEIDNRLIKDITSLDKPADEIRKTLLLDNSWTDSEFSYSEVVVKSSACPPYL